MRALQIDEVRSWCEQSSSGVKLDQTGHLRYAGRDPLGIRINIPPEAAKAVVLVSTLLAVEEAEGFYGGLLLFTNWDFGAPRIERCGLRILEKMRQAYGVMASIENAPGQLFRTDEIVDAQAFLTLPLFFGWDAFFAPHGTRYLAYARQNGSLFLVTDTEQVLKKLQAFLSQYHPALGLPSYLQGAHASL